MISTKNILPVTTVKRDLMKLLKKVVAEGDPLIITRDGQAAGVLMSAEEYEGLMETLEILSDKALIRSLKRAEKEFGRGRVFSHKQIFEE